jgi:hypothetical protein
MIVLNMSHEEGEKKSEKEKRGWIDSGVEVYYVITEVTSGIVCLRWLHGLSSRPDVPLDTATRPKRKENKGDDDA